MSIADTTTMPMSLTGTLSETTSAPRIRGFFVILTLVSMIAAVGAGVVAWRKGWFHAPPLPSVITPIIWPEEPVPLPAARRTLSGRGLTPAPDPRLIEIVADGVLPVRADDGATPLAIYARPLPPQTSEAVKVPRVALILRGAGIGQLATLEALLRLPSDMSFAVSPYARELDRQADEIREEGHEIFLDVPIASRDQVFEDTGPKALISSGGEAENHARLKWSMARVAGYAGLVAISGSEGAISPDVKDLLAKQSHLRGLGLVTKSSGESGPPADQKAYATIDGLITRDLSAPMIDQALDQLIVEAKTKGSAIGVAVITPLAIERLKKWSEGLTAQGVQLVPASAVLMQQR